MGIVPARLGAGMHFWAMGMSSPVARGRGERRILEGSNAGIESGVGMVVHGWMDGWMELCPVLPLSYPFLDLVRFLFPSLLR